MFKNYLKLAVRNIKNQKVYSFINIGGLAIGLMCCILIFLYVDYELNYDRYHENAEEIYRVVMKQPGNVFQGSDMFNATTGLLAPTLETEYPEVVRATRIGKLGGFFSNKEILINYKENSYLENKFFLVDPEFLMIFTFPLIAGDPETALNEPFTILLTQSMAKKYFGNENPVGKTLHIDKKHDYQVTGILKDIPEDSHFKFDFLTSLATGYSLWGRENIDRWIGNNWFKTYVQLQTKTNPRELESKLPAFVQKYIGTDTNTHFYLQPLTAIHLHGNINFDFEPNGDIRLVYFFSAI
ncbi:MAG: ABC transporter permease, partial [Candidatus Aminicenantes bacterium]